MDGGNAAVMGPVWRYFVQLENAVANRQHNGKSISRSAPRVNPAKGEPVQPTADEQSGSAGRPTIGNRGTGQDSGQGKYGQSGGDGKVNSETDGQAAYRRSGADGGNGNHTDSNRGSGSSDMKPEDEKNMQDDGVGSPQGGDAPLSRPKRTDRSR
jgi:hypothetical protein